MALLGFSRKSFGFQSEIKLISVGNKPCGFANEIKLWRRENKLRAAPDKRMLRIILAFSAGKQFD
jgi:hypothetical protein